MSLSSFPLDFISSFLEVPRWFTSSWFLLYSYISPLPSFLFVSATFVTFDRVRLENSPRLGCQYIGFLVHGSVHVFLSKSLTNSHGSILFLFVVACGPSGKTSRRMNFPVSYTNIEWFTKVFQTITWKILMNILYAYMKLF